MTSDMASLILIAVLFVALIGVAVYIIFLRTLQAALERCAPSNRTVQPGQVWLSLIPLFNIVWQFILVSRVAESLGREFAARQGAPASPEDDYGKSLGTTMCALSLSSIIPFVGILTGLAGSICWIVYWVRIAGYSRALDSVALNLAGPGPAWEPPAPQPQAPEPESGTGWVVLAVLALGFGATHLQGWALSLGLPLLQDDLHLSGEQTGWLFSALLIGMMAGYILITAVTALAGTRWGALVSLAGVTLAACASGLAPNFIGLIAARALMGVFVAGLLPAGIQAIREWFPSRMRPLAIGLFLASGQLASAVAQPLHALLPYGMGWRVPIFAAGGAAAIAAILCFLLWPADTPREPSRRVSGGAIASAVMLAMGLLLTTPVVWLLSVTSVRMAGTINLAAGACGAMGAGALAWAMISGGVGASRTRAVLLTVCGVVPLVVIAVGTRPLPLVLVAVCSVAYLGWTALLYAAVADTLPARGVAIGAAIGALVASLSQSLTFAAGRLLSSEGAPLVVAASATLALVVVALLAWLVRQEPETAGRA
jgi:MFS family permease